MDRSENMRRIRSKDMRPELAVRSLVHRLGYRFRLHSKHLPGKPDMVFTSRRKVIFVHGCFWHCHEGCSVAHLPKTNQGYWGPKLQRNRQRDQKHLAALAEAGWEALIVWECEITDIEELTRRVGHFLKST